MSATTPYSLNALLWIPTASRVFSGPSSRKSSCKPKCSEFVQGSAASRPILSAAAHRLRRLVQSNAAKPSSGPGAKEASEKKRKGSRLPDLEQWEEGESLFPVRHPGEFPAVSVSQAYPPSRHAKSIFTAIPSF
jgi:hypothetical protein